MNTTSSLDLVALCVLAAGAIFSPQAAALVGPYVAIIIASSLGASFAVASRERTTRLGALWFFVRVTCLACLISGFCSAMLARAYPGTHESALLMPVAFFIGFIGDDWPGLLAKLKKLFFVIIDTWRTPQ